MSNLPANTRLPNQLSHVAFFRPYKNKRPPNRQYSVDLTRMHDAGKRISHDHHMQIGSGEWLSKPIQGLVIRKLDDIAQSLLKGKIPNLCVMSTAANKIKHHVFVLFKILGGFKNSVQRVTWTMISSVHHDIFPLKLLCSPKWIIL